MSLSEYAKAMAGRWMDRRLPQTLDLGCLEAWSPIPVTGSEMEADPGSEDDGSGIWLPAGLVDVHDEVNVAGRWHRVTGTTIRRPDYEDAGFAELRFGAGWSLSTGYMSRVYVRTEADVIGAQIGGGK